MTAETLTALAERVEALSGACPETDVLIVQGSLPMSVEKVARAIPDEAVEAALEAHWRVAPIGAKDMASAMRAALEAALAAMGEPERCDCGHTIEDCATRPGLRHCEAAMGEREAVAWLCVPTEDNPNHDATVNPSTASHWRKIGRDVQPLYASPRPVEEAVKAERERCARIVRHASIAGRMTEHGIAYGPNWRNVMLAQILTQEPPHG